MLDIRLPASVSGAVSEAVSETASEGIPAIEFEPNDFVASLPDMGLGMLGIFVVIGAIILVTYGLNAIFSRQKKQ